MLIMDKNKYIAPQVDVLEVEVEKGFALSSIETVEDVVTDGIDILWLKNDSLSVNLFSLGEV